MSVCYTQKLSCYNLDKSQMCGIQFTDVHNDILKENHLQEVYRESRKVMAAVWISGGPHLPGCTFPLVATAEPSVWQERVQTPDCFPAKTEGSNPRKLCLWRTYLVLHSLPLSVTRIDKQVKCHHQGPNNCQCGRLCTVSSSDLCSEASIPRTQRASSLKRDN